ncbi:MAG: hypothetical protein II457_05985 [Paludibacteraceae bacterium]|jgi:hypothetical protein|nr:hypothetical protein [Paludibacteraceae bacterium]
MKKILFVLAVALVAFTACQKAEKAETVYSVDEVYVQGDALVGDTILVEGNCMHLCVHGGKKAFLRSSEEGEFIRANAVDFDSFAGECVNNKVRVRGVLRAMEVPAEQPVVEEHQHEEGEEACGVCSSVKKFFVDAVSYEIITE